MSERSVRDVEIFRRLESAQRILIAGAGGGFDVFAGLPLYAALTDAGKDVELANLSFTYLAGTSAEFLREGLAVTDAATRGQEGYAPERYLCEFLSSEAGAASRVFCFEKTGVHQLADNYRYLAETLELDAIVLVDGGTDILMRGDECELGTPSEDMASLAAVSELAVETKLIACLGFGIDAFHGVCHASFLENVAALSREGAYLGAHSLLAETREAQLYQAAIQYVHDRMPARQSIVNGCVASALEGRFGNVHRTERTRSSELFINPLMTLYFSFELEAVARRNLYLDSIRATKTIFEVVALIEAFRETVEHRPWQAIPH